MSQTKGHVPDDPSRFRTPRRPLASIPTAVSPPHPRDGMTSNVHTAARDSPKQTTSVIHLAAGVAGLLIGGAHARASYPLGSAEGKR